LKTIIGVTKEDGAPDRYVILEEKLYIRRATSVTSKANLFVFGDENIYKTRDISEEQFMFLKDDVSIVIALGKTGNVFFRDLTEWTDFNVLNSFGNFSIELIQFLDSSIEYIRFNPNETELIVKFKKDDMPISMRGMPQDLFKSLSVYAPRYKFAVSGIFCHQKPLADFGIGKSPELGDMLLVYIEENKYAVKKCNALLMQAKKIDRIPYIIHLPETHQLKLYEDRPTFKLARAGFYM